MMMTAKPRLAVLIDAENVSASYAARIMQVAVAKGDATVRMAFGNWSSGTVAPWRKELADRGFREVQHASAVCGKNTGDIGLVIAGMDLLHGGLVEGFVIASSDSDFTGLAVRIREAGKTVIGIGEAKTVKAFRAACSEFVVLELKKKPSTNTPDTIDRPRPSTAALPVVETIKQAMEKLTNQDGWYHLGALGHAISKIEPSFRATDHGHATLKRLLKTLPAFEVGRESKTCAFARLRPNGSSASMH
jgi:hypothetical protein